MWMPLDTLHPQKDCCRLPDGAQGIHLVSKIPQITIWLSVCGTCRKPRGTPDPCWDLFGSDLALTFWGIDTGPLRGTVVSGTRVLVVDPLSPVGLWWGTHKCSTRLEFGWCLECVTGHPHYCHDLRFPSRTLFCNKTSVTSLTYHQTSHEAQLTWWYTVTIQCSLDFFRAVYMEHLNFFGC